MAVIGSASNSFSASNVVEVTFSSPPEAGDVVVLFIASNSSLSWISIPVGWETPLDGPNEVLPGDNSHASFAIYHIVTEEEADADTVTYGVDDIFASETGDVVGVYVRGVDPLVPIDAFGTGFDADDETDGILPAVSGSAIATTGGTVLRFITKDSTGTWTTPAGHTELVTSNTNCGVWAGVRDTTATAATNVDAVTIASSTADEYTTVTIVLTPIQSTPPPPMPTIVARAGRSAGETAVTLSFPGYVPVLNDIIVFWAGNPSIIVYSTPSGWTDSGATTVTPGDSTMNMVAFYRLVDAADVSAGVSQFTATGVWASAGANTSMGVIIRGATGIDGFASISQAEAVTSYFIPSINGTDLSDGSLVVAGVINDGMPATEITAHNEHWTREVDQSVSQRGAVFSWNYATTAGVDSPGTTVNGGSDESCAITLAFSAVTADAIQEGYRWREDDGDEDGATWAEAQDTPIIAPADENRRLRVLVDTATDLGSTAFKLYYKPTTDTRYRPLEIGSGRSEVVPVAYAIEYDVTQGLAQEVVEIDSTHWLVTYQGSSGDGFAQVFTINADGLMEASNSAFEFDTADYLTAGLVKLDSNHFLVAYRGAAADGFARVLEVNLTTWAVTAPATALEFDTSDGADAALYLVDSTHVLMLYRSTSQTGQAQTLEINTSTWAVTEPTATFNFTTFYARGSLHQLNSDNTKYITFFNESNTNDGMAQVLTLNTSTWLVTSEATLEFDTTNGVGNATVQLDGTHFFNVWGGGGSSQTMAQVFSVNTSTWAITAIDSPLNFAAVTVTWQRAVLLEYTGGVYRIAVATLRSTPGQSLLTILEVDDSTWVVTKVSDSLIIDSATQTSSLAMAKVSSTRVALWWGGADSDGFTRAFDVLKASVWISPSANITAGGEATTAQLTAPSGKTTGDFTTGRMWDNENGTDTIDIGSSDYTELEWSLQSTGTEGNIFEFRVLPLNSWDVIPTLEIGAGAEPIVQTVDPAALTLSGQTPTAAVISAYLLAVLADDPVALWMLDETTGTNANDSGPNGLDGTYTETYTLDAGDIFTVPAPDFNNAGYVTVPDHALLSPQAGASGIMTVEALYRPDTLSSTKAIVSKGSGGQYEWMAFSDSTDIGMYVWTDLGGGGVIEWRANTPGLVDDTDYHIVWVYDRAANIAKIYLNGVDLSLSTSPTWSGTPAAGTAPLQIGERADDIWQVDARIAGVALYDTVLSAGRIGAHYNAALSGELSGDSITQTVDPAVLTLSGQTPLAVATDLPVWTNLVLHLDATTLVLSNNDPVSTWEDLSPNNADASHTGDNRPIYIASALNGLPGVRFDGTDDWLEMPTGFSDWTAGWAWFFVINPLSTGNGDKILSFSNTGSDAIVIGRSGTGTALQMFSFDSSDNARFFSGDSGALVDDVPVIISGHNPAGAADAAVTGSVRINDVAAGSGDTYVPPVVSRDTNYIGVSVFGAEFINADFHEIVVYNRALTSGEVTDVYEYLDAKWLTAPTIAVVDPAVLTLVGETPDVIHTAAGWNGAITVRDIVGSPSSDNAVQSITSDSFTPAANSLLFVQHSHSASSHSTAPDVQISNTGGLTFDRYLTDVLEFFSVNDIQGALFVAEVGESPSAMTVTVDPFTTTDVAYQSMIVYDVTEAAILQTPEGNIVGDNPTTLTTEALSTTTDGNLVIVGFSTHTTAGTAPTAPTGFTELATTATGYQMNTVFYATDFVGTDATSADLGDSMYAAASWILEIEGVGAAEPIVQAVDPAVLTLTGQTPGAAGTGSATIAVDPASLTLAGETPGASGTDEAIIVVDSATLSLVGQTPIVFADTDPLVFTATPSATFAPEVGLIAGATSTPTWRDSTESVLGTGLTPSFTVPANGIIQLVLLDGSVKKPEELEYFNCGFNSTQDSGTYNIGAGFNHATQPLTGITSGLQDLTNLKYIMCNSTTLTGFVDFTGLSNLEHIEFYVASVTSVDLTGCSSLIRACFEQNHLAYLDLSPVKSTLRDLRAAEQNGSATFEVFSDGPLPNLYHYCVRTQIMNHIDFSYLPGVQQFWAWNSSLDYITGLAGTNINSMQIDNNSFPPEVVDQILEILDDNGLTSGALNISNNPFPPTPASDTARANLLSKGWSLTGLDASATPPTIPTHWPASVSDGSAQGFTAYGSAGLVGNVYDGDLYLSGNNSYTEFISKFHDDVPVGDKLIEVYIDRAHVQQRNSTFRGFIIDATANGQGGLRVSFVGADDLAMGDTAPTIGYSNSFNHYEQVVTTVDTVPSTWFDPGIHKIGIEIEDPIISVYLDDTLMWTAPIPMMPPATEPYIGFMGDHNLTGFTVYKAIAIDGVILEGGSTPTAETGNFPAIGSWVLNSDLSTGNRFRVGSNSEIEQHNGSFGRAVFRPGGTRNAGDCYFEVAAHVLSFTSASALALVVNCASDGTGGTRVTFTPGNGTPTAPATMFGRSNTISDSGVAGTLVNSVPSTWDDPGVHTFGVRVEDDGITVTAVLDGVDWQTATLAAPFSAGGYIGVAGDADFIGRVFTSYEITELELTVAQVDPATLTLTGQTPSYIHPAVATVDPATLTISGQTPTAVGTGTTTVTIDPATLTLTAETPTIIHTIGVAVDPAILSLTGVTPGASGTGSAIVITDAAALTLTGVDPEVSAGTLVVVTPAILSLTPIDVTATGTGVAIQAVDPATLTFEPQTPLALGTGTTIATIDTAFLLIAAIEVAIIHNPRATIDAAILTLTGIDVGAAVGAGRGVVEPAILTLEGVTPEPPLYVQLHEVSVMGRISSPAAQGKIISGIQGPSSTRKTLSKIRRL